MTSASEPSSLGEVDYALFDADQHDYEARDCLTRHLEKRHRHAVRWAEVDGQMQLLLNDRRVLTVHNPTFDPMGVPGCFEVYFRAENHEDFADLGATDMRKALRDNQRALTCPV